MNNLVGLWVSDPEAMPRNPYNVVARLILIVSHCTIVLTWFHGHIEERRKKQSWEDLVRKALGSALKFVSFMPAFCPGRIRVVHTILLPIDCTWFYEKSTCKLSKTSKPESLPAKACVKGHSAEPIQRWVTYQKTLTMHTHKSRCQGYHTSHMKKEVCCRLTVLSACWEPEHASETSMLYSPSH